MSDKITPLGIKKSLEDIRNDLDKARKSIDEDINDTLDRIVKSAKWMGRMEAFMFLSALHFIFVVVIPLICKLWK